MTFITKRRIRRRTVLRGLGASLALPFLDGMVPALSAQRPARRMRRLGVVYVPNGMAMHKWTPITSGEGPEYTSFEFSPTLKALEPQRVASYLHETASLTHLWYHKHHVLNEPAPIMSARLVLARAAQIVLRNGLGLLGITAPERM